jgi:hypothetical protein
VASDVGIPNRTRLAPAGSLWGQRRDRQEADGGKPQSGSLGSYSSTIELHPRSDADSRQLPVGPQIGCSGRRIEQGPIPSDPPRLRIPLRRRCMRRLCRPCRKARRRGVLATRRTLAADGMDTCTPAGVTDPARTPAHKSTTFRLGLSTSRFTAVERAAGAAVVRPRP